jgi:hypothetical protein
LGAFAEALGPPFAGAIRFFGASAPVGRFLFFWAPGAVKKDDMAAIVDKLQWFVV